MTKQILTITDFAYRKEVFEDELGHRQEILVICGQEYTSGPTDFEIYDAIQEAKDWPEEKITFENILKLRDQIKGEKRKR